LAVAQEVFPRIRSRFRYIGVHQQVHLGVEVERELNIGHAPALMWPQLASLILALAQEVFPRIRSGFGYIRVHQQIHLGVEVDRELRTRSRGRQVSSFDAATRQKMLSRINPSLGNIRICLKVETGIECFRQCNCLQQRDHLRLQ
jgi:hypothetical protein